MASSDHYRQELSAQLGRAATRGMSHILINARELHSSLGDFPDANDRMVSCRLAMRAEMKAGDVLLVAEDNAAGMTVRYVLPRNSILTRTVAARHKARGLLPEALWPNYLNFQLLPVSAGPGIGARL